MIKSILYIFSILVFVSLLFSCGSSKINKDQASHNKFVEQSKLNNEVVVSLDTVFSKGNPYAVMKTEGFSFASLYTFYSINGEKAISVIPYNGGENGATSHHEFEFYGTSMGMKAYVDFAFSGISVCETIIKNNLMTQNGLNPLDVATFVNNHPRPPKFNPAKMKVVRDMKKEIKINQGYGEIYQGNIKIGLFTQGTDKSADLKKSTAVFIVKFLNQTNCAEIRFSDDKYERNLNPFMSILTEFDGKMFNSSINDNNRTFDIDAFKQAVEYLVQKGYL
ncbi:MAG: hypothetical protein A2X64_06605 [Ignavibacteria bacterium GWF2_33_9]|nr:MAG: hypothetical protein A2X64_06605 [Ignavibacteria bacterium GWF2_33_9]